MPPHASSRSLLVLVVCCAPGTPALAQARSTPGQDVHMMCVVNDHEILGNAMTWQGPAPGEAADQHVFVRRLAARPPLDDIREDTVFAGPTLDLGGGVPRINQSSNGPELGFDAGAGIEVVYTLEDPATHDFYLARQANSCFQLDDTCWSFRAFPNANPGENRWRPFVSSSLFPAAKVAYFRTIGPRDTDVRIAWRDLEDADPAHEHVIDDPRAYLQDHWEKIDDRPFLVLLYGAPDADSQVALYDATAPHGRPPLQIVTSGPGTRVEAAIALDPASGRYTLIAQNTIGAANVFEVYQRIGRTWTHLYDFDAAQAGETDPTLAFVQSPEPFVYGNRLYLTFVTADTGAASTATLGNIRVTRIETDGPPTWFKLLNDASVQRKRIEPEVHYPRNDAPVVFYMQRAELDGEDGCNAGNNTLRRARTLLGR